MDFDAQLPLVILLAGGKGTRLSELFPNLPKALVAFQGKPFLHHLLARLRRDGAGEIVLALGHGADEIRRSAELLNLSGIHYSEESEPRGTGGAIADIVRQMKIQTPFVIANADTWWDFSLKDFFQKPPAPGLDGSVALVKDFGGSRYTTWPGNLCFSGLAWLQPGIFQNVSWTEPTRMEDVWDLSKLEQVHLEGRFYDYGTAEGFHELETVFASTT